MSGQSTVFLSNLFPLEISTDALNRCFGHRIKCVKRLSLLFLQVITTISGLILHNYLSLFCIKRALLLCEEKLFPKIPPSSCNALYEQFADFLRSSSCLLLWLFTHPVIANRFIRIKYEFWIKIIKPRFSWLPVVPTIFLTVWRQNIMCSGSFVLNYETIKIYYNMDSTYLIIFGWYISLPCYLFCPVLISSQNYSPLFVYCCFWKIHSSEYFQKTFFGISS